MHIPVLQVRLGLSWSIPVPLHSNSFISTGLPVNTFICAGQANPAPTSAPGREGAGACSSWPIVRWPVNRLSLHLHQYENLIGQDVNRVGRYSNCSFCSSSSSSSWVHSNQPHFPSCCQLRTPACSFHVVNFVENPFQSTSPSWEIPLLESITKTFSEKNYSIHALYDIWHIYADYVYTCMKNLEKPIFSHANFVGQQLVDLCHSGTVLTLGFWRIGAACPIMLLHMQLNHWP